MEISNIAILTSGGDCQGMNTTVNIVVRIATLKGLNVYESFTFSAFVTTTDSFDNFFDFKNVFRKQIIPHTPITNVAIQTKNSRALK